ncbi:MAG: hypothetical protein WA102_05005 [Candidatus Methanoperedens sp.]
MHIATHIIKIKGTFDSSWDEKKLRAYVDLKIKNEIEDVLHPSLDLFETKDGIVDVWVFITALPSEATYKVVETWIKDHIKEDGLSVTEFNVEMLFNMCSSETKFTVLTSENEQEQ